LLEHADEEEEIDDTGHEKDDHTGERLSSKVLFHRQEAVVFGWAIIDVSEQVEISRCANTLAIEIVFENGKDSIELLLHNA
jgi:hypothetical protein